VLSTGLIARTPSSIQKCKGIDCDKTNKREFCEFAKAYLKTKCWHCGNIVAVGKLRCNGADHEDWEGRYLHKACWKVLKSEKIMINRPYT
jgi:hypothetical protein